MSRRRLICQGDNSGSIFVVSDTGYKMVSDSEPAHLLKLYRDWLVEK
jgi:hypothetical protein